MVNDTAIELLVPVTATVTSHSMIATKLGIFAAVFLIGLLLYGIYQKIQS